VLNPARGFMVTANNRPTSNPVAALLTDQTWALPYRAVRVTELLDSLGIVDAASTQRAQMDVTSSFARKHRMTAAAAFRDAEQVARVDSLAAWDGTVTVDRREPVYFYAWLELVRFRVARELYEGPPGYFPTSVLDRMLEAGQVSPAITIGVVREAVANAGAYRWGDAHLLHLDHPLAPMKVLGRLMGFGRQDIPIGGDAFTVNASAYTGRFPPFRVNHGASQRHVVDLVDPDGAGGFILPGGESGFPGSPHAFDQLPLWLEGSLVPIPLARARAEARTESRFRLVPR
jgi:penicillin amidase